MVDLSDERREEMLTFLNTFEGEHLDDESNQEISKIKDVILEKKFGLKWEKIEENIDDAIQENIPVLIEDVEKEIVEAPGEKFNFLLEGDNLQSLILLGKTHLGKIDVIYIDPPYNTGKNDFIYDDAYVEKEDGFRHSKWLSFMETRMRIAYNLLADDGVLFASIDDNEQAELKMLLDEIFGEKNFVIEMPRLTKKSGKTAESFAKNHDYVLVYTKKYQNIFIKEEHNDSNYSYSDEFLEQRGKYKLNQTLDYDSLSYSSSLDYPLDIDGEIFYPGGDRGAWESRQAGNHHRADWNWRWSRELFEFGYKNGFVVIKRKADGTARVYTKTYLNAQIKKNENGEYFIQYIQKVKPMSSIDLVDNIYSNDKAKKDLSIFGMQNDFDYSKPVELIKRLLKCYYKKNATVLDFFAGSGTTAQAVLEQNVQDGGHRQFILCTNNQNNICERITYKRCKDVIMSYSFLHEDKDILLSHKIMLKDFKGNSSVIDEINMLRKEHRGKYNRIVTEIKDEYLYLYGIRLYEKMSGIPANLKYFKCSLTPRHPESYLLSNMLCLHIREMIELQTGMKLDNQRNILILNKDDYNAYISDNDNVIENVWLNQNCIFNAEEMEKLEEIGFKYIPKEFFGQELREASE